MLDLPSTQHSRPHISTIQTIPAHRPWIRLWYWALMPIEPQRQSSLQYRATRHTFQSHHRHTRFQNWFHRQSSQSYTEMLQRIASLADNEESPQNWLWDHDIASFSMAYQNKLTSTIYNWIQLTATQTPPTIQRRKMFPSVLHMIKSNVMNAATATVMCFVTDGSWVLIFLRTRPPNHQCGWQLDCKCNIFMWFNPVSLFQDSARANEHSTKSRFESDHMLDHDKRRPPYFGFTRIPSNLHTN